MLGYVVFFVRPAFFKSPRRQPYSTLALCWDFMLAGSGRNRDTSHRIRRNGAQTLLFGWFRRQQWTRLGATETPPTGIDHLLVGPTSGTGERGSEAPIKSAHPSTSRPDPCDLQYNDRPLQRRSPSHQPSQPANAAVGSDAPAAAGVTQGRKSQIPGGIGAAGPIGRAGPGA